MERNNYGYVSLLVKDGEKDVNEKATAFACYCHCACACHVVCQVIK